MEDGAAHGRGFAAGSLKAAICAALRRAPQGMHVSALLAEVRRGGVYQPPAKGCGSASELPKNSLISALNDTAFERCAKATFRMARGTTPASRDAAPSPQLAFPPPSSRSKPTPKRPTLSSDDAAEEEAEDGAADAVVLEAEIALAAATELRVAAVAAAERSASVANLARATEREARRRLQAARAAAAGE